MKHTDCIILAAGYSSRADTNKMLLRLGNKTIIERCIEAFSDACSHIIVVGGYRIDELRPILMPYKKLQLVYNEHYSDGMFCSVREGLQYITGDQFFITPGDYPLLKQDTIDKLLEREEPIIIPCYHGINGHPVLINSNLIPEILGGSFESLREFIASKTSMLLEVNDIGVITDIDYKEDYDRVINMLL